MSTASAAPPAPAPQGIAIAFCDGEERDQLRDIERLTRQTHSRARTAATMPA